MTRRERVVPAAVTLAIGSIVLLAVVGFIALRGAQRPVLDLPALAPQPSTAPSPPATGAPPARVDPYQPSTAWVARTAAATGTPERALAAYARANLRVAAEEPGCRVSWNTIAALGGIESGHGSSGDAVLGTDGRSRPAIRGPALDGNGFAAIRDTDGGELDDDAVWDRAVGPLQFIPQTWRQWAADGNGDGASDPDQIDDAALAATRYLCHSGDLRDPATWRRAIFSFNHSDAYVADIARLATTYAERVA